MAFDTHKGAFCPNAVLGKKCQGFFCQGATHSRMQAALFLLLSRDASEKPMLFRSGRIVSSRLFLIMFLYPLLSPFPTLSLYSINCSIEHSEGVLSHHSSFTLQVSSSLFHPDRIEIYPQISPNLYEGTLFMTALDCFYSDSSYQMAA